MTEGKGWNGQKAQWRGTLVRADGHITVGVCAREKKALSKHMVAITSRLNPRKFKVCYRTGPYSTRVPGYVGSSIPRKFEVCVCGWL